MIVASPHLRIVACAIGWLVGAGLAFPAIATGNAPPRIEASLERDRIFKGESVVYSVDVLEVAAQGEPDVSGLVDFIIESKDDQTMNYSSTTLINGRMRNERRVGHRFMYRLTPKTAGTFVLPAPKYVHDGETYTYMGPELRLEVIGPQPQELVAITTRVDRRGTRPLQPLAVRVRLFVKKFPPPNDGLDPVAGFSGESPNLRIPWVTAPEGLEGDSIDHWLGARRARGDRGFSINELTFQSNDIFNVFAGSRLAIFAFDGRPATEKDFDGFEGAASLVGRSKEFYVYEITRNFTPTRPGRFELAPITLKGDFGVDVKGRQVVTKTIFDEGEPISFDVDDAPQEGRPASYCGAFGRRFTLDATVTPNRGRVGDPLALSMRIRGEGNLQSMRPLELSAQPGIAGVFTVEQAGSQFENGVRTLQYVLRANSETVREIPSLELSWFDVDANTYASTRSAPLELTIDSVSNLGSADIVTSQGTRASFDGIERADGLFGNRVDPAEVGDERVDGRRVFAWIGMLALAYAALSIAVSIRDRKNADPARVRRRGAVRRMNERIAAATSGARENGDGAAESLQLALLGLVADAGGLPESGVTGKEALKVLAACGVAETLRGEFTSLVDHIDRLRFGGGTVDADLAQRAKDLAATLATELEELGRLQ